MGGPYTEDTSEGDWRGDIGGEGQWRYSAAPGDGGADSKSSACGMTSYIHRWID